MSGGDGPSGKESLSPMGFSGGGSGFGPVNRNIESQLFNRPGLGSVAVGGGGNLPIESPSERLQFERLAFGDPAGNQQTIDRSIARGQQIADQEFNPITLALDNIKRSNQIFRNEVPLAVRSAIGAFSPVPIEVLLGGTSAVEGLFGQPTGFITPETNKELLASLERPDIERSGGESRIRTALQGLTPLAQQQQGFTQEAQIQEELPQFNPLIPNLMIGGRSLADIIGGIS